MAAIREDLSGTSEKLLLSFSRIQKVGKRVASLTGGGMGSRPLLESAARASKAARWAMTEAKLLLEAAGATQAAAAAAEAEVKTVQAAATGAAAAAAAAEQATTAAAEKEMQAAEVVAQAAAARAQAAAARTQAEEVAAAARQAADTTAAAAAALGVGDMYVFDCMVWCVVPAKHSDSCACGCSRLDFASQHTIVLMLDALCRREGGGQYGWIPRRIILYSHFPPPTFPSISPDHFTRLN